MGRDGASGSIDFWAIVELVAPATRLILRGGGFRAPRNWHPVQGAARGEGVCETILRALADVALRGDRPPVSAPGRNQFRAGRSTGPSPRRRRGSSFAAAGFERPGRHPVRAPHAGTGVCERSSRFGRSWRRG